MTDEEHDARRYLHADGKMHPEPPPPRPEYPMPQPWRNPFRRRWGLVIIGLYSGATTPVTFMRFWRRKTADRWVVRLGHKAPYNHMLRYEVRKL